MALKLNSLITKMTYLTEQLVQTIERGDIMTMEGMIKYVLVHDFKKEDEENVVSVLSEFVAPNNLYSKDVLYALKFPTLGEAQEKAQVLNYPEKNYWKVRSYEFFVRHNGYH